MGCNLRTIEIQSFHGAIFKDHLLSALVLHIHFDSFKKFKDLIFVDDKLPAKTAKLCPWKICMHITVFDFLLVQPRYNIFQ